MVGFRAPLAGLILGIFLMGTALLVHLPEWLAAETEIMGMNPFLHMVKDFGLGGAAFLMFATGVSAEVEESTAAA
jgi:uncharacterized membrane protein YphA (DoxX/SURF4 family)